MQLPWGLSAGKLVPIDWQGGSAKRQVRSSGDEAPVERETAAFHGPDDFNLGPLEVGQIFLAQRTPIVEERNVVQVFPAPSAVGGHHRFEPEVERVEKVPAPYDRPEEADVVTEERLPLLLGGADEDLVDGDGARPGDDISDRVGDVLCCHGLPELALDALKHLGSVMRSELGRRGTWLDQRDAAHVALGQLLAERLAEGADAVLGQAVDAVAVACDAACDRADVDHVCDVARAVVNGAGASGVLPRPRSRGGRGR